MLDSNGSQRERIQNSLNKFPLMCSELGGKARGTSGDRVELPDVGSCKAVSLACGFFTNSPNLRISPRPFFDADTMKSFLLLSATLMNAMAASTNHLRQRNLSEDKYEYANFENDVYIFRPTQNREPTVVVEEENPFVTPLVAIVILVVAFLAFAAAFAVLVCVVKRRYDCPNPPTKTKKLGESASKQSTVNGDSHDDMHSDASSRNGDIPLPPSICSSPSQSQAARKFVDSLMGMPREVALRSEEDWSEVSSVASLSRSMRLLKNFQEEEGQRGVSPTRSNNDNSQSGSLGDLEADAQEENQDDTVDFEMETQETSFGVNNL